MAEPLYHRPPVTAAAHDSAASVPRVPNPPCALCGATDWRPHLAALPDYLTGEIFDLERCGQCDLIVTTPAPPPERVHFYYPPRYRTDRHRLTGGWRVRRRAAMLAKHFPRGFRGRLLDLGCGNGAFAVEMQRRGWQCAVTELDEWTLDAMRTRGIEAKSPQDAQANGFAGIEKFDAITCWHVLEHVPDPLALSRWSRDQLAATGVFQATVPNLASWQAARYGRNWFHLDVPRHLYHFTPATLNDLMTRAGLRVESTSTMALEYDVFGVVQSSLNRRCDRPNVLFERLTAPGSPPHATGRDVSLSYLQLPVLCVLGLAHTLAAAAAGAGATLTVTCRPLAR
jgi:SAM-dependent methyltransferase